MTAEEKLKELYRHRSLGSRRGEGMTREEDTCKHINMRRWEKDGAVILYCPDCGFLPYSWGIPVGKEKVNAN